MFALIFKLFTFVTSVKINTHNSVKDFADNMKSKYNYIRKFQIQIVIQKKKKFFDGLYLFVFTFQGFITYSAIM